MSPTEEQQKIIAAARDTTDSIMIEAFAGTGKSSTLKMLLSEMRATSCLGLAFNVKNKKDLEAVFPEWTTVKTFNGLGHSALQKGLGRQLKLDDKKLGRLVTEGFKRSGLEQGDDGWELVRNLVSSAMQQGLIHADFKREGLKPDRLETWAELADLPDVNPAFLRLARAVLYEHTKEALQGTISFDDQIYMSTMFDGAFVKYNLILVDEAQDLNVLNHLQVKRSLATGGRLIVVGDSRQAIYAFRGAHSESMQRLRDLRPNWQDHQLSLTFRCPKQVVRLVSGHAIGFRAAPQNEEGQIIDLRNTTATDPTAGWTWKDLNAAAQGRELAVICRTNAPLLSFGLKLLKKRIGIYFLGRDIGRWLINLSKKIVKDSVRRDEIIPLIQAWMKEEIDLATVNKQKQKIGSIQDRGECLIAVAESLPIEGSAQDLRQALKEIFDRDKGQVVLSSGHKAKGLEWNTVLHLDPWRCPSRRARQEGGTALEQELNLEYVIHTRAKKTLVFANLNQFLEESP